MKKILLVLSLVITIGFGASAHSDGWFKASGEDSYNERNASFGLPTEHGLTTDAPAPLGEGLLILTAMGAGYAIARRKRK